VIQADSQKDTWLAEGGSEAILWGTSSNLSAMVRCRDAQKSYVGSQLDDWAGGAQEALAWLSAHWRHTPHRPASLCIPAFKSVLSPVRSAVLLI
jgi:hypothetical protein